MKRLLPSILLNSSKLKPRGMYVIKTGDRQGGFLIWIKEQDLKKTHAFLFCPNPMEALFLSQIEIKNELKTGGIEFVEQLPVEVYEVCCANWTYYKEKS